MRAVVISEFGPPGVLKVTDIDIPQPGPGEVLIQVQAAGIARADLLQRQGKYAPPSGASDIPGLDVAGIVETVGTGVTKFVAGDRVCAILTGGGYAEFCTAPQEQVLPTPDNWTSLEAATLPENLFTVYDNVVTRAALSARETILIHGGSSGIGTMAVRLATLFEAKIIVTAGSDAKCQACRRLGAHHAINYRTSRDFAEDVLDITNGKGVDVILDMVGGAYLARNLTSLATEGRLVIIATQGGHTATLDIVQLMKKRARVMGSTMRTRSVSEKGEIAQQLASHIWPGLPARTGIYPVIDSVFPLREAAAAHSRMESGESIGKIVLKMGDADAQRDSGVMI
jgi:NADPH2:quinone reductase